MKSTLFASVALAALISASGAFAGEREVMTGANTLVFKPLPSYEVTKANPSLRITLVSRDHRNVRLDDGQTLYGKGDSVVFEDASEIGPRVQALSAAGVVKVIAINENRSQEALANRSTNGDNYNVAGKRGSNSRQ